MIGLLWFDGSQDKLLETKVAEAVSAYRSKPRFEGKVPDTCFVHPSIISGGALAQVGEVQVVGMPAVCPYYFFVVHAGSAGDVDF